MCAVKADLPVNRIQICLVMETAEPSCSWCMLTQ